MPGDNPVIELVNVPVPAPLTVFVDKSIVGLLVVDQTTPLAMTASPEASVILPPLVADIFVMEATEEVVRVETGSTSTGSVLIVSLANNSKLAACVEEK